jgi:chaperonin cofactor prefoldin
VSELIEIVDALETKVSRLLFKLETLRQVKDQLERDVEALKVACETSRKSAELWEERYNSLKMAHAMLGSETNKTEAKLKINALIRELDQCIAYLSE